MANRNVAHAVRVALVTAGAVSAGLYGVTSSAQERLGEVVITGTRIVRQDYAATSPVVTVSEDVFKLSGEPQIEKVLNELPQLVPSVSTTSNNPSNGGQANISLRGLGTGRTLVLMDGTRLQPSNVSGVIDVNTIPGGLIENVEILTGGASSTYGSDAIAGVVNFRMKRDFEGVLLSAQAGVTGESDGRTQAFSALMGGNFADGRGNAVLSLGWDTRDEILAGDRPFGEVVLGRTLTPSGSGTTPDGGVSWGSNGPAQATLNTVFSAWGAPDGIVPRSATIGINTDGTLFSFGRNTTANPVVNYRGDTSDAGFNPLSYSYNFGPVNYLQLPLSRRQVAAFARYDIVPETVEMYARFMFTTYSADQQLAATPISSLLGSSVPVTNTVIPAGLRTLLMSRGCADFSAPVAGVCADGSAQNIAQRDANFTMGRRTIEVGPRSQHNTYDTLQGLVGFRGVLPNDWHWDAYASWGGLKSINLQGGNVSRSRYNAALINPAVYASSGCASFNPFGAGNITPACAAAVAILATNVLETENTNFQGSLTGSLFDLPAGPFQFAIGASYGKSLANFRPDEFLASGDVVGFNAQQPVSGMINATEEFVELAVPLLKDMAFADSLGLELGYRHTEYNLAGTADTYKVALQWSPIESLNVRASFNHAIAAPSISALFLPVQENFPRYVDPCNWNSSYRTGSNAAAVTALCQAQGIPANVLVDYVQAFDQARSFVGGNVNLTPEIADTWTYGFTWQPVSDNAWASNLSLSVDYFKIEIEDAISALSVSSIIGRCFNDQDSNPTFSINNQFCQLFARNDTFRPDDVVATNLNLAAIKHEGVDLQIDWGFPLSAMGFSERSGALAFKLLWSHLLEHAHQETSADSFYSHAGTISDFTGSAFPTDSAVLTTTWSVSDFSFRYNARYIDGMDAVNNDSTYSSPTIGVKPYTPTYVYHDLAGRWQHDKYTIALGINNIANKKPPIYTTDSQAGVQSNTDGNRYDVLGRRYFLNVSAKF